MKKDQPEGAPKDPGGPTIIPAATVLGVPALGGSPPSQTIMLKQVASEGVLSTKPSTFKRSKATRENPIPPEPPEWFPPEAHGYWVECRELVVGIEHIKPADNPTFELWVLSVAISRSLAMKPNSMKPYIVEGGKQVKNLSYEALITNIDRSARLGAELGFSPTARARVEAQKPAIHGKGVDPWAAVAKVSNKAA